MINKPNEEEQLAIVVKNLLPRYHKFLFAQNFLNFKALIAVGTQIEDAINNGIIKNEDGPKFKRNFGPSSSKTTKVSNVYKTNPYQLIVPVCKYHKDRFQGLGENFMNFTCWQDRCLKSRKKKGY